MVVQQALPSPDSYTRVLRLLASLDAYELRYLTAHLVAAERDDSLHALLALEVQSDDRVTNAWFATKAAMGDGRGYGDDIALALLERQEVMVREALPENARVVKELGDGLLLWFDDPRDALYTAYVHRESYRLYREMTEQIMSVVDPRERLIEGMMASLRNVRESPALASWLTKSQRPIGAEMAEQSEVIKALTEAFVISLAPEEAEVVEHRARWLVRVMTSLLLFPGHDEADERAMLEEFVVPIMVPAPQATQ